MTHVEEVYRLVNDLRIELRKALLYEAMHERYEVADRTLLNLANWALANLPQDQEEIRKVTASNE